MAKRYSRAEFLARFRAQVTQGRPLVVAGAGNGITARCMERGGVDAIGVYTSSYLNAQGHGPLAAMLPIADANELVYTMGRREVLRQVREIPVVAGLAGVDPLRDMKLFLEDCHRIGFSGVHNFPSVGWLDGEFRRSLEASELGIEHEISLLLMARDMDMLTVACAFNEADCERLMREATPDVFIFHAGLARAASGNGRASDIVEAATRSQRHYAIARRIKPDVILLASGAALANPEDVQYFLDHTDCHGVQLGCTIDPVAVERPVEERAAAYKSVHFPTTGRPGI